MNDNTQKLLSGMAKCAGLTLEFPEGAPICISGFQNGDSPFFLISPDQPDSELIFVILQKIGLVATHNLPFPYPWFFNRPYENERLGQFIYTARRATRQKLNLQRRATLWALCAYVEMRRREQFKEFLHRHPDKWKFMPFVYYGIFKGRLTRFLGIPPKFSPAGSP